MIWHDEVRCGRTGQAFDFGVPDVFAGATANSLDADRRWPQQVDQIVKTKPLRRSRLRILDQSLEPREPALQGNGRLNGPAPLPGLLKGGLDDLHQSRRLLLTSNRSPAPDALATSFFTHWSNRSSCLSSDSLLLV
jgi:hypothetical protein